MSRLYTDGRKLTQWKVEQYFALGRIRNYATSDRGWRVLFSVTEEQGDIFTVYCRESRPNGFEHNTFTFVECIKVIREWPILMMAFLQHIDIDEAGRNGSRNWSHGILPPIFYSFNLFLQLIACKKYTFSRFYSAYLGPKWTMWTWLSMFLDALASLDLKLSVSQSFTVFQIFR